MKYGANVELLPAWVRGLQQPPATPLDHFNNTLILQHFFAVEQRLACCADPQLPGCGTRIALGHPMGATILGP